MVTTCWELQRKQQDLILSVLNQYQCPGPNIPVPRPSTDLFEDFSKSDVPEDLRGHGHNPWYGEEKMSTAGLQGVYMCEYVHAHV